LYGIVKVKNCVDCRFWPCVCGDCRRGLKRAMPPSYEIEYPINDCCKYYGLDSYSIFEADQLVGLKSNFSDQCVKKVYYNLKMCFRFWFLKKWESVTEPSANSAVTKNSASIFALCILSDNKNYFMLFGDLRWYLKVSFYLTVRLENRTIQFWRQYVTFYSRKCIQINLVFWLSFKLI